MNLFKISTEEKNVQLVYLVVLWVFTTLLFWYVCFKGHETKEVRGMHVILEQINEQKIVAQEQKINEKHLDTLNKMLMQYNPGTSQVYLESGISYELAELRKAYEKKKNNVGYRVYHQVADLYEMYYFDKKGTWVSVNNNNSLKKNLENCEIGFRQLQDNITLQEALRRQNNPGDEQ
ncbi:MAG TPA: type VI secretion system TssO [Cytophagales bacterium]|nr:type VI secretion system TssO [Cytophagales bacterium]